MSTGGITLILLLSQRHQRTDRCCISGARAKKRAGITGGSSCDGVNPFGSIVTTSNSGETVLASLLPPMAFVLRRAFTSGVQNNTQLSGTF